MLRSNSWSESRTFMLHSGGWHPSKKPRRGEDRETGKVGRTAEWFLARDGWIDERPAWCF